MRKIFMFALLGLTCHVFSQFAINGKVTDGEGKPLSGANVVLENVFKGSVTDDKGMFEINNLKRGNYVVQVSFMGYEYKKESVYLNGDLTLDFALSGTSILTDEVVVKAIRADEKTPTTYSFIDKETLEKGNRGKDVPYLLAMQPSVQVTSDAGSGIGYTSLRIRGVDSRQINVTINGIPLNDAESHGVYWVDIPDITGSTEGIQIQRGVGTSTNGAGAFGGSINLNTDNISKTPGIVTEASLGSFNTSKYAITAKTGLINDHYFMEGKFGQIASDGYRDRAWADLTSYLMQGGYIDEKTMVKLISFGGREKTYQAWYGASQDKLDLYGRTFNPAGAIFNPDSTIKSFYDNFIDHYSQDHFQLHWVQQLSSQLNFNAALHYTYGRGYYEEYIQEEFLHYYPMTFYNMDPILAGLDSVDTGNGYETFYHDTINYSDVIRRLWLDNHFYGATWSLNYQKSNLGLTFGGAFNQLTDGKHFGEVIWARYASNSLPGHEFYNNVSEKSDFNSFIKATYNPFASLDLFADLQYRNIHYRAQGLDREWTSGDEQIDIDKKYHFFNPKFGAMYEIMDGLKGYASYAIANREPNRSDFLDAPGGVEPKPEKMGDLEVGLKFRKPIFNAEVVFYEMQYRDQLVQTGLLNEVGTPIRKNVGASYRRGLEISAMASPHSMLTLGANLTLSDNRTSYKTFNSEDSTFTHYNNVKLAYSPSLIANGLIRTTPIENLSTSLMFRHVGKQYVNNTENSDLQLPEYTNVDFQLAYAFDWEKVGRFDFYFNIHNLFDELYSSYGIVNNWTQALELFPQAGRHYMTGVKISF
jgi:iron complex outermembrane recepter protein